MTHAILRNLTQKNPCLDRGLIVFPGHGTVDGAAGDHLLLGPPLVITAGEVRDMLAILKESIEAVGKSITV